MGKTVTHTCLSLLLLFLFFGKCIMRVYVHIVIRMQRQSLRQNLHELITCVMSSYPGAESPPRGGDCGSDMM